MSNNQIGCQRIFNKEYAKRGLDNVVHWDVIPVANNQMVTLIFEQVNSKCRQGVWLSCDNGIMIENTTYKCIDLWYDTAPSVVTFTCYTSNGLLSVYNIFDLKGRMSLGASSGMLVEEQDNLRRYRCNDYGYDGDFTKLIFRIQW